MNDDFANGPRIGQNRRPSRAQLRAAFPDAASYTLPRRKSICTRSLELGSGSCPFWWETCPAKVKHCLMRFIRENQQVAGDPEAEAEALARWQAARDAAVQPQQDLL